MQGLVNTRLPHKNSLNLAENSQESVISEPRGGVKVQNILVYCDTIQLQAKYRLTTIPLM